MVQGKILIIIWRWSGSPSLTAYPISNHSNSHLFTICFDPDDETRSNEDKQNQVHQELSVIFNRFSIQKKKPSYLLLVHQVLSFSFKMLDTFLAEAGVQTLIRKFSGGQGFIYYNLKRDTGLIHPQIGLANNAPYTNDLDEDEVVSIFDKQGQIIDKYFKDVWAYYLYLVRRQLFEAYERISRLKPEQFTTSNHPISVFAKEHGYTKLSSFFAQYDPKEGKEIENYLKELTETKEASKRLPPETLVAYRDLFLYSAQPMNKEGYQKELSSRFIKIINLLPEAIY